MSQRRGVCLASPWRWERRGEGGGREEEGKGRRELARPVGLCPLLHSQSFCHDYMILVNARPLVLEGRKRNQGGSDRAGRAARLTRFPPAQRLPLWYGGAERGRPCARGYVAEEDAVACDERERETLLRETAALLCHRGAEGAVLVWQGGDR